MEAENNAATPRPRGLNEVEKLRQEREQLLYELNIVREALRLVCKDASRNEEYYLSMAAAQQLLSGLGEGTEQ